MFADDTKIWAKIQKMEDKEALQSDLDNLVEWSQKRLLAFNIEKCKVMHIGHDLLTKYTMADGDKITQLETTTTEKDLGIWITNDLKPTEQCVQAARKAQSVLGMVNRHFKNIDKEDFDIIYKTYVRPHLEYTVYKYGHRIYKRIKPAWKKYREEQRKWLKV